MNFLRHLFFLSFFTFCLLASPETALAQRGNYNFLNFEQKPFYFGIALGINRSSLQIHRSSRFILNEEIGAVESKRTPGLNLGIISNLKIHKYFDLRFVPSLVLGGRNLTYTSINPGEVVRNQNLETAMVELPFQIRYKSAPYRDKRLFVLAGMKYSFDMASKADNRDADDIVKISPTDFALEIGAGMQFFLPFFIFSPEIKFSQGIGNIHLYNNSLGESTVLEKVLSRTLTLSLNFEG